jgi:hypothetical protein
LKEYFSYYTTYSCTEDGEEPENRFSRIFRAKLKSMQLGKPVLISEIGYRESSDAGYNPYQREASAPRDDAEQAALYDAALQNRATDDKIIGVFFWAWQTPPFAPDGKAAAQVLHTWYTRL